MLKDEAPRTDGPSHGGGRKGVPDRGRQPLEQIRFDTGDRHALERDRRMLRARRPCNGNLASAHKGSHDQFGSQVLKAAYRVMGVRSQFRFRRADQGIESGPEIQLL